MSLKPEYVIFGLIVISTLMTVIVILINNNRKNKIVTNIFDQNKNKVKDVVVEINNTKNLYWPQFKKKQEIVKANTDKLISSLENELTQLINNFKEPSVFKLLKSEEDLSFLIKKENLETHIKELKEVNINDETVKENKHHFYLTEDEVYAKAFQIFSSWKEALLLYNQLQSSIEEALSSVDSAQFTETVDLFSKNKGISVISTLNNMDANEDIEKVSYDYQALKQHLENLKLEYAKDTPKLSKTKDVPDLIMDMVFDFSFDFMSIFSLFKLNDAEDELESFKKNIIPMGLEINKNFNKTKDFIDTYLISKP